MSHGWSRSVAPRSFTPPFSLTGLVSPCVGDLHLTRFFERDHVARSWDLDDTERAQMRCRPLHVEQPVAGRTQPVDQVHESDLRRVDRAAEHRLAGEEPTDGDAV